MANTERNERVGSLPLDPTDTVIAGIILAACAYLWYVTTTFDPVPSDLGQNVLPQHFPRMALVFIALCALVIPFENRIFPDRWRRIAQDRSEPVAGIAWITMLFLIVSVAIEPHLGTVLTILLVCIGMPLLWGERRFLLVGTFALLFTVAITLVFSTALGVYFEPGVFNISF